jgi:Icc-related predicted phosphoesterase
MEYIRSYHAKAMKIVVISDTHGLHRNLELPDGEILIHAGDLTHHGKLEDVREFNDFLGTLPHPYKIVIAGNHDFCFESNREACEEILTNCIYLQDQELTINGIKFYGSPWQPWFYDWAFNLQRGPEIRAKWELISKDTNVLITHGPPYGIGDVTARGDNVGCADLWEVVQEIQPAYHIFGHIHEGYGVTTQGGTTFINASCCDQTFQLVNPPIDFNIKND